MRAGFVGQLAQVPEGYRCYLLFLPGADGLKSPAEQYVMEVFWEFSSAVEKDVLVTGIARGEGLEHARERFGLRARNEASFVVLDRPPQESSATDLRVSFPLVGIANDADAFELLGVLLEISRAENFMGQASKERTIENIKATFGAATQLAKAVKIIIGST